ncbi:hypothetical protein AV656_14285 [Bhargavaea cecembensis]|uniref:Endonuclease/exonuclease/phosphatase domain-containing protein n=1 Tax=Bhargavaea cecembensis TaxID=394098 RepID=A0A165GGM6_9BACL|nr:hypothetical protein [Bhargavaea cecembensis]KZE36314.1 hypothetical protein AV656_14285 [Bhargavaea cecembensis]
MGKLRVITWNLSVMGPIESKWSYLQSVMAETDDPTIIALQEVKERDRDYLMDQKGFNEFSYSLEFRQPGLFDGANRKMGCLIGGRGEVDATHPGVLTRAPFPDRTVFSDLLMDGMMLKCLCFHSLTGVGYKKAKTAQFIGVAEYLHQYRGQPFICCFDANEPEIDHVEMQKMKYFNQAGDQGKGAEMILGPKPVHRMKDAYRIWLDMHPKLLADLKQKQADLDSSQLRYLPLAVSHLVSRKYPKRYDYIFVSDHFKVIHAEYRLEEAIRAGGDHAMVIADLEY